MKKESRHPILGCFIAEELRRKEIRIKTMCKETHIGTATYEKVKKGMINL